MRVAEIIGDFRNTQTYIARIDARPSAEDYNEEGYAMLRQCLTDSQALLAQPFQPMAGTVSNSEQQKLELQR